MFGRDALIRYIKNPNNSFDEKLDKLRRRAITEWGLHENEQSDELLQILQNNINRCDSLKREIRDLQEEHEQLRCLYAIFKNEFPDEKIVEKVEIFCYKRDGAYPPDPFIVANIQDEFIPIIFINALLYERECQLISFALDVEMYEQKNKLLSEAIEILGKKHDENQNHMTARMI